MLLDKFQILPLGQLGMLMETTMLTDDWTILRQGCGVNASAARSGQSR